MADTQISLMPAQATKRLEDNPDHNNPVVTYIPLILTAVTFLATFLFQIHQNRQQESFQQLQQQAQQDATLDSEWRKALEHLTAQDGPSASVGGYEMVSFLGNAKYSDQALAIVPSLLTRIDNPLTFDVILFDINAHVTQSNQGQLIAIDTILVRNLNDLYRRVAHSKTPAKDQFEAFLQAPDHFIDNPKQSDLLNQAWTQIWELDSVSSALSNNWRGTRKGAPRSTPRDQDLSGGVVLLNNDWRGVDFSEAAALDGAAIFGKCKIDRTTKLPSSITVKCTAK